ncbi:hypothetical protein AWH56_000665 [Anaerobacillus isosaccharinicus]|uniref:6-bladed beta-propeller n=1 Tax=Anaerobacillus isosaccharinicus TaxID=1532552 RepID=A0A1S2LUL3_9BACI|nr:hypothetical protein [Anaerobacillus isosaccharinicus]MBA5585437.1 hypothetical protein [Anaerobacillus isosaccharinicus]QOY36245.1 hypothetical protein AWH56_000665 [Anaerobacillus isosaccharinicus]
MSNKEKRSYVILSIISVIVLGIGYFLFMSKGFAIEILNFGKEENFKLELIVKGNKETPLSSPLDLTVTNGGNLYVTDSDNNRIQVFNKKGEFLFHFGGEDSEDVEAILNYPVSIAVDNDEIFYIVDLINQRIAVFSKEGQFLKNFYVENRMLIDPTIVTYSEGFLYFFDKFDHQIKKFTLNGNLVLSFGTQGNGDGQFQYPFDIAVLPEGNIIVSDTGNGRIQVFNEQGIFQYSFKGSFGMPSGIAVDHENIYITDPINSRVVVTTHEGKEKKIISKLNKKNIQLNFPEGLEVANNRLYIVDKGSNQTFILKLK